MQNITEVTLQSPESSDGYELNRLIEKSPPLDPNSVYCNLLQCTHLRDTCIAAKSNEELVGFVSGYPLPAQPNTLFIWQVVVAEVVRSQGLASRMLLALLNQPACQKINFIETTITPDNTASQSLFRKLGNALEAEVKILPGFDQAEHFNGQHESEELWRIGPIKR